MSILDLDFSRINARTVATEASPVAIENVLQAALDEISRLRTSLENVSQARMPGEARRLAVIALAKAEAQS